MESLYEKEESDEKGNSIKSWKENNIRIQEKERQEKKKKPAKTPVIACSPVDKASSLSSRERKNRKCELTFSQGKIRKIILKNHLPNQGGEQLGKFEQLFHIGKGPIKPHLKKKKMSFNKESLWLCLFLFFKPTFTGNRSESPSGRKSLTCWPTDNPIAKKKKKN